MAVIFHCNLVIFAEYVFEEDRLSFFQRLNFSALS